MRLEDKVAIVTGAAQAPKYLYIGEDKVELRDASHVWGKGIRDTEDTLRKESGLVDFIAVIRRMCGLFDLRVKRSQIARSKQSTIGSAERRDSLGDYALVEVIPGRNQPRVTAA